MKNGYKESVLDTEQGECYFCGLHTDTARHEIFYGVANRKKAKALGYWVNLCPECHRQVHAYPNDGIDRYLKQTAQMHYELKSNRMQFIAEWGRSYL